MAMVQLMLHNGAIIQKDRLWCALTYAWRGQKKKTKHQRNLHQHLLPEKVVTIDVEDWNVANWVQKAKKLGNNGHSNIRIISETSII